MSVGEGRFRRRCPRIEDGTMGRRCACLRAWIAREDREEPHGKRPAGCGDRGTEEAAGVTRREVQRGLWAQGVWSRPFGQGPPGREGPQLLVGKQEVRGRSRRGPAGLTNLTQRRYQPQRRRAGNVIGGGRAEGKDRLEAEERPGSLGQQGLGAPQPW